MKSITLAFARDFSGPRIGPRVMDMEAFLYWARKYLIRGMKEKRVKERACIGGTRYLLKFDEEVQPILDTVSSGVGCRDCLFPSRTFRHQRDGRLYLQRRWAFPTAECHVMIMPLQVYIPELADDEEAEARALAHATHVVTDLSVQCRGYAPDGFLAKTWPVADPLAS